MQENCQLKKRNGLVGLSEPASLFYKLRFKDMDSGLLSCQYLRELPYELIKSVSWVLLANQGSLFARQPRCITYLRSLRSSIKSFMFLSLSCLASPLVPLYMKSTNDSPWDAHVWQHVTIRSLRIWGSIPVMFSTLMFPVWVNGNWFTYGGKRR